MKKRKLSDLPRPKVKKRYLELRKMVPGMRGIVTAEKIDVDGMETLVVNCFKAKKKTVIPWFRTFCQEEEYITQDLTVDKVKWRTAAFDTIIGYRITDEWRTDSRLALATLEDGNTIVGFMREWQKRTHSDRSDAGFEFDDYIVAYQRDIRERNLAKKHQKEIDKIDAQMEQFGELPADYQQFIEKTVFDESNYFFYSRKAGWAFCTRCGHEYEIRKDGIYHRKIPVCNDRDKLKHNNTFYCPHCNKPIVAKSAGMGRGSLLAVNWSVLIQTSGEDVLVRYFCHSKDFRRDYRHPQIKSKEMFRSIHASTEQKDFEWEEYRYTHEMRWCKPRNHPYFWNPSEFKVPRSTVLYNKDFGLLADTCMRYSCLEIFLNKVVPELHYVSPWIVDNYFNFYRKYPFVEQMLKIGWYHMMLDFIEDNYVSDREFFKTGRTISETLGISREQFLILREATNNNPRICDVNIIRYAGQTGKRLTVKDLSELQYISDNGYVDMYKKYIDAMEYTTIHKLTSYITKQGIKHDMDYFDYTGWLQEMGYDMRNEFNLYPKNFKAKHDEMSEAYMKFKNKKNLEDIKKFNCLLKQMRKDTSEDNPINMAIGGLFIRLPYQAEELKTEGETLHHCVGTYIDRVMKGETTIFFVRQVTKPDIPYYTLEWKNHKVVQCRGLRNCNMVPEVKAFVELFQEKMLEYEKAPKKQRKAG